MIGSSRRFLLDHPILKYVVDYTFSIVLTALSAFFFAYGFRAFISPTGVPNHLVSGGASGISQVLVKIIMIFETNAPEKTLQSIVYFVLNVPLFILSWFKIGKRFTILTFINVLCVSLFIEILPNNWVEIFSIDDDFIARALFAGLLTGISSALAFLIGGSAGGIDVIALYIAEKKSTSIGKYSMSINATIVISYVLVDFFESKSGSTMAVTMALYTIIYFFTSSKVVDILNTKNRKTELQIFTSSDQVAPILIHAFPHGCTIVNAKGGYSGSDRKVIYMVVSYSEVKKAVKIMREVDPNCFVTVMNSYQVYGKFYIRPIK